jgi:hypothetical protein
VTTGVYKLENTLPKRGGIMKRGEMFKKKKGERKREKGKLKGKINAK